MGVGALQRANMDVGKQQLTRKRVLMIMGYPKLEKNSQILKIERRMYTHTHQKNESRMCKKD